MIRVAVAGVGSLGRHHARILSQLENVKLEYLVDTDVSVKKTAELYKCGYAASCEEIIGGVDACVISLPTVIHYQAAKLLLENGIHCLVEKPFTTTVRESEELIEIAKSKNLVLQIGHVERFNPAVIEAQKYIKNPIFFEFNRLGVFHKRAAGVGVVLDLMIHDLDIVLFLAGSEVVSVDAVGGKILTAHEDIVKARLKFKNGSAADISASRVTFKPYRKARIFQRDSYISIDFAKPSLKVYVKKKDLVEDLTDIKIVKPRLKKVEPLEMELEHFVGCCISGAKPLVAGEHGRNCLELAWEILKITNK